MIENGTNKIVKLLKSLKQRRNREEERLFIAEGYKFAVEASHSLEVCFFVLSESFVRAQDTAVFEQKGRVMVVKDSIFAQCCDTVTPQGVIAVCPQFEKSTSDMLREAKEDSFFLVADGLQDPGNLGTVIRTADACGAKGIFLSDGCVDLYNPKVLRSTMGSIFHLDIVQGDGIASILKLLKQHNFPVYGSHLEAKEYPYSLDFKKKCAFVIGNEARGMSEAAAQGCDLLFKLPMPGRAQSLNASVAASVILYEVVRQRI